MAWEWPAGVTDGDPVHQWKHGPRPICPPEMRSENIRRRELERRARTCTHWRGLYAAELCAVGLNAKEAAGFDAMDRKTQHTWWSHSPCVGAEGCRACERYQPPTEDELLDRLLRESIERAEAARLWAEEQERKAKS